MGGLCLFALGCSTASAPASPDDEDAAATTATSSVTASAGATADTPAASSDDTATQQTGSSGADDDSSSTTDAPPVPCGGASMRLASFNIQEVGDTGSPQFSALLQVLRRIDADVVCMEEIEAFEDAELAALASDLGYSAVLQADPAPAIGGDIDNACISRIPAIRTGSYTATDLSTDPSANDVGRDILAIRAEPAPGCDVDIFVVHLKAGLADIDRFRRQIEAIRLDQAVERRVSSEAPLVVCGDFNETPDAPQIGSVYSEPPGELPGSYQLGSDIALPLSYDPFALLVQRGLSRLDPTHEDSPDETTFSGAGVRLDYVWYAGLTATASEIYNACQDNGVDDEPPGNWLPKASDPLECSTSAEASDHFPIVVDLDIPPEAP
jgi:endonuclease/exonuclease/phosphatase family metal-dependent hydrolase